MDLNPNRPQVLGNQWVPINQADYTPDAITERGYDFTTPGATGGALQGGSFTVASAPVRPTRHTAQLLAIYPQGTMDQTGPIYETLPATPESQSVITEGTVTFTGGASGLADALVSPNDAKAMEYRSGNSVTPNPSLAINFFFNIGVPAGRRILGVYLDYQMEYPALGIGSDPEAAAGTLKPYTAFDYLRPINMSNRLTIADEPEPTEPDGLLLRTVPLGELNFFWDSATVAADRHEIMPWTSTQLGWFTHTTSTTNRLAIQLRSGAIQFAQPGLLRLGYLALRVRYCVEKRVRFGAFHRREAVPYSPVLPGPPGGAGSQYASMRDITLAKTALPAGAYTITSCNVYSPDTAPAFPLASPGTPPPMAAIRQQTGLPVSAIDTVRGWLVSRSTDLGATFAQERSHIIVPATLGHSTGPTLPVGGPMHSMARQIAAPVYGSIEPVQVIDTQLATGLSYVKVSFIARRIAGASSLRIVHVQNASTTATISAADFDALPEIIDGWKLVTLLWNTPITVAAAATLSLRWTTVSPTADEGTQWQVLGAQAVNMTSTGGTPSPPTWSQAESTYSSNTGVIATWKPPLQATQQSDLNGDLTVWMSATPAPVTGFTATPALDDVVNYADLDPCENDQCCIPTQVGYIALAWTPTVLPPAQFGEYRLQRQNIAGAWETIMTGTDPAVASFNDYEARIGYASNYRIIVVDASGVEGALNVTASATIPAPGFTTACGNSVGLLSLTTNWGDQSLNVAYKMIWESDPEEGFFFPESQEQEYSRMYQRDYQVQFHPTERGGEVFTRDLLIHQGVKIGDPAPGRLVLANINSLRNVAYADIPYVCVRDENGNVWYAGVRVPEGQVSRIGKAYVAKDVEFTQVTATPAPVVRP